MKRVTVLIVLTISLLTGLGVILFLFRDEATEGIDDVQTAESHNEAEVQELPSVTELKNAVVFADAIEYYQTRRIAELRMKGEGIVLLPKPAARSGASARPAAYIRQDGFVGPESCRECHQEVYEGFVQTAHYQTSSLPSDETIQAELSVGGNRLESTDAALGLEVGQDDSGRYQQAFLTKDGQAYVHRESIDIVTGSGNHGQTFLYWNDDLLYELPMTWFTSTEKWVHSPGYSGRIADFARPIDAGCMACHATLLENDAVEINRFDPDTMILGVSCERCHGPGEDHVKHHRANPESRESKFITHPNNLSRERMNDVCGQCHTGTSRPTRPPFSFRPGDRVADFKQFPEGKRSGSGVHTANQQVRMVLSKCYTETDDLNCASCHNPHKNERGDLALFSQRCIECHAVSDCGQHEETGDRIAQNCIDCHMPKQDDTNTRMTIDNKEVFPQIRDHYIRPNDEATNAVLKTWLKSAEAATGTSD